MYKTNQKILIGIKKLLIVSSIVFLPFVLFAQEKKGDKALHEKRYVDAVKYYKKAVKKHPNGDLYQKLGKAYLYSKNYNKAEESYQQAMNYEGSNDSAYFEFAKALMVLNHKTEAKKYFEKYAQKYPQDNQVKVYLEAYNNFFTETGAKGHYKVEELNGAVNTPKSEFGAVPYKEGLLYVTEGKNDWVNDEINRNVSAYFDVYFAPEQNGIYTKGEPFSPKINGEWNEGTVAITPDGKTLYFTTTRRSLRKETMRLYSCEIKENGKLGKPQPFEYNSREYSILHPAFSEDGRTLYFASDKKGGRGGFDLYYCKYKRNYGWGAPQPVHGNVNTGGNEVFPHINKGRLFFASDGHLGLGGLDLYTALESEYFKNIKNLGTPINTNKDDFAIYYSAEKNGFFSSDREGGKGKDDIYRFTELKPIVKVDTSASISGIFEFLKIGHANTELILYDEDGNEIDRVFTDKDGRFQFRKLKSGANYTIKPAEDLEDGELFITNSKGEKVLLVDGKKGKFIFKTIESSYTEELLPIEDDDPSFLIMPVKGMVFKKIEGDLGGRKEVRVYDQDGKLIGRTYTEKDGTFVFKTLTPQNSYHFEIEGEDDVTFLIFKNGEKEKIEKDEEGRYVFSRLKGQGEGLLLVNEDNQLIRIGQKERFAVNNILYDYNSAALNMDAKIELNKLFMMYRKNKHLKFTIESHTDSRGSDKYNLKLSEKRAKKVIDYLVKKGIPKDHLKGIGYGETRLLNKCKNGVECTEEEHAVNRRTEVIIEGKMTKF